MKKTPFHKLPPRAIRVWQWTNALGNLFFLGIPVVYYSVFGMDSFHFWILLLSSTVILAYWIFSFTLLPFMVWKNWRYAVDSDEIDLKRGVIIKNRTLIPLSRVQHVDTRQGPILRWYNLASVTISTAATTHEITALDEVIADRVRDQISKYARLAEEDV